MIFQNPIFLYGLIGISIPILIHLFNFQRFKPEIFSNLSFLINLRSTTRCQSEIKRWLLLAIRILLIATIVFIFANPIIPKHKGQIHENDKNNVILFLDNSNSMSGIGAGSYSLFESAKMNAIEAVKTFKPDDRYLILSNELEGSSFRFINQDEALNRIEEIEISDFSRNIKEVFERIDMEIKESENQSYILYLSDFQWITQSDFEIFKEIDAKTFLFHKEQSQLSNLYIDSCWFELPIVRENQQLVLNINVVNASDQDFSMLPLWLHINGEEKSSLVFNIDKNSQKTVQIKYVEEHVGQRFGEIKIEDKGYFNFDDNFYFSYKINPQISVSEFYGKKSSPYIRALFDRDSSFYFESVSLQKIDYSTLSNIDFIILSGVEEIASGTAAEFEKYLSQSGTILFIPNLDASLENLNTFSSLFDVKFLEKNTNRTQIEQIAENFDIFKNVFEQMPQSVDMPSIGERFIISSESSLVPIIKNIDGSVLLGYDQTKGGKIYFMSIDLDERSGNFHQHALIVPTILNMALFAKNSDIIYYTLGSNEVVELKDLDLKGDGALKLTNIKNQYEFIPSYQLRHSNVSIYPLYENISAGNYRISYNESELGGISYNRNPSESILNFANVEEIETYIRNLKIDNVSVIESNTNIGHKLAKIIEFGTSLQTYLILFALLLLVCELLIFRLL